MSVSYSNLFKILIDKGLKKKDLQKLAGISSASVSKLAKNEYVSLDVLVKICKALDLQIEDVIRIIPDIEEVKA